MSDPVLINAWFPTASRYATQMVMMYGGDGVDLIDADWTAEVLKNRPPGGRVLVVNGGCDLVFRNAADLLPGGKMSVWFPNGIATQAPAWLAMLDRLRTKYGITLDEVVLDGESGPTAWARNFDPAAIMADPRWPEAKRAFGFPDFAPDWSNVTDFNAACYRKAAASTQWFGEIVAATHGCGWSNYGATPKTKADAQRVPDFNNVRQHADPDRAFFYSPVWNGYTSNLSKNADGSYGSQTGTPLTSYDRVRWLHNDLPCARRADAAARFRVWTTSRKYTGPIITDAHLVELRTHALIAGNGKLLHWAGPPQSDIWPDGLTPEEYAADDRLLDEACTAYLGISQGRQWAELVGLNTITSDAAYCVVTAGRYTDRTVRGRLTWGDRAVAGRTYTVTVAPGVKFKATRGQTESGLSFAL